MSQELSIEYTIHIWQEGDQFIAQTLPLDVMSSGSTPAEARLALYEAVELFLETAREMGTLEEILEEAGYRLQQQAWVSPPWVAIERHAATLGA